MKRYFQAIPKEKTFKRLCSSNSDASGGAPPNGGEANEQATPDSPFVLEDALTSVGATAGACGSDQLGLSMSAPTALSAELPAQQADGANGDAERVASQEATSSAGRGGPAGAAGTGSGGGTWPFARHPLAAAKEEALGAGLSAANGQTPANGNGGHPLRFLSWNANSFLLRMKDRGSRADFFALVERLDPDVVALQEVRMPAGRLGKGPGALRNRGVPADDTKVAREERQILMQALATPPLSKYRAHWSLADNKYGGTGLLVRKELQPSVSFSLKAWKPVNGTATAGAAVRGGLRLGGGGGLSEHEPDGRVILAEFPSLLLLNTYVPNNGWRDDDLGFRRRRKWDAEMADFLARVRAEAGKPLIWCGDLNVAHMPDDVSHPEFFKNSKLEGYVPPDPDDAGQPGYTPAERRRFGELLERAGLVDTYRALHPRKDFEGGFTWSGHPVGKFSGKRMRIDYFAVDAAALAPRVLQSDILGSGTQMLGFVGSDHSPIFLALQDAAGPVELVSEELRITSAVAMEGGDAGEDGEGAPDFAMSGGWLDARI